MNAPVGATILPEEAGGVLTIDLGALAANWRLIRDRGQGAECGAVVKANAYGLGIEQAVPALARAGCRTFFVAHIDEGKRVRAIAPDAVVYILNGLLPGTAPVYAAHDLRPVLGSRGEIAEWTSTGGRPAALHVDTGLNRLGLSCEDALAIAAEGALTPALLMTHLASAEETDNPVNARQREDFQRVREAFAAVPASFCNSSGAFLPGDNGFELLRPGYALYGGNPLPGRANPMKPVVRLEAHILQLREVPDGTGVGYNAAWTAKGPRRLATISLGYADGYPRTASATDAKREAGIEAGVALVAGRRCPFAGTISMDLIILDVSDVPAGAVARGDRVTLIGDDLTLDEVGRRAGTIGYEILTSLGTRYARIYLDDQV
ncbi:MAG TPA: alanine racemase [Saliniramus sp.]|nr:alanine racemase [Saliniramus sp.]